VHQQGGQLVHVQAKQLQQQQKDNEMSKRRAELQTKREEEVEKRKEHAASIVVRKVIQRIRVAIPENLEALRIELEKSMSEQLDKMGSLADKIQQEAEKELLEAQKRVDELHAKRLVEEQKKQDIERKKREDQRKANLVVQNACDKVQEVQDKIDKANQLVETFLSDKTDPEEAFASVEQTEECLEAIAEALSEARKSASQNAHATGHPQAMIAKISVELKPLHSQLQEMRITMERLSEKTKGCKDRLKRRVSAVRKERGQREQFDRYDADGDGELNREEVCNFAMAEYEFDINAAALDKILSTLAQADGGVPFSSFSRMRAMVAIEKSVVRAREKKAEEEERHRAKLQALEAQKEEVRSLFKETEEAFEEAQVLLGKAEELAKTWCQGQDKPEDNKEAAEEIESLLVSVKASIETGIEHAQIQMATQEEPALETYRQKTQADFQSKGKSMLTTVNKLSAAAKSTRDKATRVECCARETTRSKLINLLHCYMRAEDLSIDRIYDKISNGGSTPVSRERFLAFVGELFAHEGDKLDEEQESSFVDLFQYFSGSEGLTREQFMSLARQMYRVVKITTLTDSETIDSRVVRRLDVGDLADSADAPKRLEAISVTRLRCRCEHSNSEGWATVTGNMGTEFLKLCPKYRVCIKETVLTESLSVASKTIRRVAKDEVLEVLTEKQDASCGVQRVRVRTTRGSSIGWVSIAGNKGTVFLESI